MRYQGVTAATDGLLERDLLKRGLLRQAACGDGSIACVDEAPAYEVVVQHLRANIDCFLAQPYPRDGLDPTFQVQDMVAL